MKRRKFLSLFGAVPVALVAAKQVTAEAPPPPDAPPLLVATVPCHMSAREREALLDDLQALGDNYRPVIIEDTMQLEVLPPNSGEARLLAMDCPHGIPAGRLHCETCAWSPWRNEP